MRMALRVVRDRDAVLKLFEEIGPRFLSRHGGYTRIMKIGQRPGDAAPMSLLELIPSETSETDSKPIPKGKEDKSAKETGKAKGKEAEAGVEPKSKPKAKAAAKTASKPGAASPKVKRDGGTRAPAKSAATMKRSGRGRGGGE
jgi:large subunit ribosomal protein L17